GLWGFSLVSDIIAMTTANPVWRDVAFYTLAAGTVSAVGAAIFGIIDYFSIRDARVAKTAAWHARFNVLALILFAADWYLRTNGGMQHVGGSYAIPFTLSVVGNIVVVISGWLGGELVYVHRVAVQPQPTEPPGTPARQ
ncbi:MAG TPA: DUF2231 domain-containing protein, partial [Chthoniobacterales bacterium]|nr:DUF2231 domain-containing protein [Chthoniobacterales bacterium]